jgi:uncharacterized protein YkwD
MRKSHRIVSALVLAGLVLGSAGALGVGRPNSSPHVSRLDSALLVQINAVRRAHALGPLKPSTPLTVAAAQHTAEMGRAGYFGHASLDHTLFWKRIQRSYPSSGYQSWDVGENLLYVAPDVDAPRAMRLWMRKPEHRANLLKPTWREIGIATLHYTSAPGVYHDKAVTILTADFGVRRHFSKSRIRTYGQIGADCSPIPWCLRKGTSITAGGRAVERRRHGGVLSSVLQCGAAAVWLPGPKPLARHIPPTGVAGWSCLWSAQPVRVGDSTSTLRRRHE